MTDLLRDNDPGGTHAPSWYAATAGEMPDCAPLTSDLRVDVCIIGGGYTGLAAALELAGTGLDVVLLEANRVGWGASGRNGGQVGTGLRASQSALEKRLGAAPARRLWDLAEEAKASVRGFIAEHRIDCDFTPGVIYAERSASGARALHRESAYLQEHLGYGLIEPLDRDRLAARVATTAYAGGIVDRGAAHLHPLNYALGLARAAIAKGIRIHEHSRVLRISDTAPHRVETKTGAVTADVVLMGCNGYAGDLDADGARAVMPINSFIVTTEPLGKAQADALIAERMAVADSNFVVNYYRATSDHRLLFGGAETYGYRFPADIAPRVRRNMLRIYPQLEHAKIEHAWGGTLAITTSRLPYFRAAGGTRLVAGGYSGHGLALATLAGRLMGRYVLGAREGFEAFERLRPQPFPGGTRLRHPLLVLAMSWYAMRDRLGL